MSLGVLQRLLERLTAAAARHPVTPWQSDEVTPESAPLLRCTPVTPVTLPDALALEAEGEWVEERAGILEYDAGIPRAEAETIAAELLQRMREATA